MNGNIGTVTLRIKDEGLETFCPHDDCGVELILEFQNQLNVPVEGKWCVPCPKCGRDVNVATNIDTNIEVEVPE